MRKVAQVEIKGYTIKVFNTGASVNPYLIKVKGWETDAREEEIKNRYADMGSVLYWLSDLTKGEMTTWNGDTIKFDFEGV